MHVTIWCMSRTQGSLDDETVAWGFSIFRYSFVYSQAHVMQSSEEKCIKYVKVNSHVFRYQKKKE